MNHCSENKVKAKFGMPQIPNNDFFDYIYDLKNFAKILPTLHIRYKAISDPEPTLPEKSTHH